MDVMAAAMRNKRLDVVPIYTDNGLIPVPNLAAMKTL
jgi:hypothetical protein